MSLQCYQRGLKGQSNTEPGEDQKQTDEAEVYCSVGEDEQSRSQSVRTEPDPDEFSVSIEM